MKAWLTVFVKEVRENARDRRTVAAALLYGPLLGPVLFAAMMIFIMGEQREKSEQPLELPVIGAEHAPNLVAYLERQGVIIQSAPADASDAIRSQSSDVVLQITAQYPQNWREGQPAPLLLIYDGSRQQSMTPVERTRALLETYSRTIAALRLQARGIAADVIAPVAVVDRNLETPQSRAGMLMAMLPYFLILSAFVGGMYLAIDTTSGERERQSLEPLLIAPVSRTQIIVGKMLATSAYASVSLLICVLAFAVALQQIPVELAGFAIRLPLRAIVLILVTVIPIALLAASTQTAVAALAKSFREAQTYVQFMMLVPIVPSMIVLINPMKPEMWMYLTPLFGQSLLISELVRGESVSAAAVAGSGLSTTLAALLFALVAIRQYRSERMAIST